MNAAPRIAVCVSTRNRAALLDRLLTALGEQTMATTQFEVVIVNDGSTDDTTAVLDRHVSRGELRLRAFHNATSLGPGAGRNVAWRAATAPYVAFTDDDCVPAAMWLTEGAAGLDRYNVLGGRTQPHPEQLHKLGPFAHTWRTTRDDLRAYATANMFYRRADLELLGGFDEDFRRAAEDTDLGLRAERAGLSIGYSAEALVWHDVRPDGVVATVRDRARAAELGRLFRHHPEARRSLLVHGLFWKRSHIDLLLLLAGASYASRHRVAALGCLPWVHRKLRERDEGEVAAAYAAMLPGLLAVDVAELVAMVRGSIRHRTLIL